MFVDLYLIFFQLKKMSINDESVNKTEKLCDFLYKIDRPALFKGIIVRDDSQSSSKNSALGWTPDNIEYVFKGKKLEFRIGNRRASKSIKS